MRILFVSQYFPPETCAPAVRVHEFSREWVGSGHTVKVLTGFPNHPEGNLHPEYRKCWRRGIWRERRDGIDVCRSWLYPARNKGFWGRSANYVSFAVSSSLAGSTAIRGFDIVIGTSPQILVGLSAYSVARAHRVPFVFEVRDLWPESLAAVGQASAGSASYRIIERIANFLYRQAQFVVVDGERKRQCLFGKGVPTERMAVIPNGVAEDFNSELDKAAAKRQDIRQIQGWGDRFIVLYCGTIGMAHGLNTLLAAAARLSRFPDVVFVIVGDGAEREQIVGRAKALGLSNVIFAGKQPRHRIPEYLAAADCCAVPLRQSQVFDSAIPSKLFEAMAAKRPVLLGVNGEARDILQSARAGLAFQPDNAEELARHVFELRRSPRLCLELGENGRRAVDRKYSRRFLASSYLDVLRRVARHAS